MFERFIAEWRAVPALAPLLLILLLVPAAFFTTTLAMVEIWETNETFTHGFLILPISLWLIWEQRSRLARVPVAQDMRALVLLAPTVAVWLLATLIDVAVLQQLAMVALIPMTVWLLLGLPLTLALLFPLLYLFFAVPLGQSLIPPMMEFTADFTVAMVQYSGIPIYRDGLSFQLPSGSWSVVEECSGVRYLIASAALGTIYAYITYRSVSKRCIFIAASLLVPIAANGLRAYGIVMIGHLSGMKYAVGADHLLYGWVFFGIVIFVLFWIGGFWADEQPTPNTDADAGSASPVRKSGGAGIALVAAAFLAMNLVLLNLKSTNVSLPPATAIALPEQIGDWQRRDYDSDIISNKVWTPIIHNPDLALTTDYTNGLKAVTVHVGYFHKQRDGAEALSSLNKLTDPYDGEWKLIAERSFAADLGAISESEVSRGPDKRLVWSGYIVGTQFVKNPYIGKLLQAQSLLRGQPQAAYISFSTPFDASLDELRSRLNKVSLALGAPLRKEITRLGGID